MLRCIALHLGANYKMSLDVAWLRCVAFVPIGHFSHIFPLHCYVALYLGFNLKMSLVLHCYIVLCWTCSSRAFLTYLPVALLCCIALLCTWALT